jgi:hypothetical protein
MDILTNIVVFLNHLANALGQVFVFIGYLPGWLSATIVAAVSGIALILAFKYTSNQKAIKRARQDIRANLLAVKLFHDNLGVGFRAQGRVLVGALRLLVFAVVPILAMLVPVTLLLGQLNLWYQTSPLPVRDEAVITLKLRDDADAHWPAVVLEPNEAVEDTHGPVCVVSQREVCFNVRAQKDGCNRLVFKVDGQPVEKELAIGSTFLPVSTRRPSWEWSDVLLNPREPPFGPTSLVQSIEVQYPARSSWTSGSDYWVYYWFAVSLVTGFCCRGLFKVNL